MMVRGKGILLLLGILIGSYTHYFCLYHVGQSIDVWEERLRKVVVYLGVHIPS